MNIAEKPQLSVLLVGEQFKILEVSGSANSNMPMHYCTSEALVTIMKGEVTLVIDEQRHRLSAGESYLIPSSKHHRLEVKEIFKAMVVMSSDGVIEFVK